MNIDQKDFDQVKDFMLKGYGINLEKKRVLVEGRLKQLIVINGFENYHDYVQAVLKSTSLQQEMVTRLTTNYTFFSREDLHYDFMVKQAIPAIIKESPRKNALKIWSAGCSSGDEAYTAAMHLQDFLARDRTISSCSIYATDISDDMLRSAKAGIYVEDSIKNLPAAYRTKYFTKTEDGKWAIAPEITSMVKFSKLNLMTMFPMGFSGFDIIFCRNVMIYFTAETRKALAKKYCNALNPGGYLFIGLTETIPAAETGFKMIRPSIFQKER